jgi:hypothetical protein
MEKTSQETLEEAAKHNYPSGDVWTEEQAVIRRLAFKNGGKWQAERMYSEEEVKRIAFSAMDYKNEEVITLSEKRKWFEQHKK